ncbi:MAG: OmpP1/FadL family transporter [Thermodesulfobacteriota bacterium]
MKMLSTRKWMVSGLLWLLASSVSVADEQHYVNMIIGDRAAGMGGAYTALADDPAGCFYNPAGIAFAPNLSLSASVNAYNSEVKTYRDVLTGTDGGTQDWEQVSSSLLPNFFGLVRQFGGNGMLGMSYAVTDSIQRRQKQYFQDIRTEFADNPADTVMININDSDRTYLFGPSYAYRFSDSLAMGATVYAYFRDREIIRNQLIQFNQGQHILINYYETRNDWGIRPSLGAIWEPMEKLALGLSMSQVVVLNNETTRHDIYRNTAAAQPVNIDGLSYDFSDPDTIYFKSENTSDKPTLPVSLTFGAAYFVSPSLLFSGDVGWHSSADEKESVCNVFLGTEYYFRDDMAVRAGFYTDFANTPDLESGKVNQEEHIDIYGLSLSYTLFHRLTSVTLGVSYAFGAGEAQAISSTPVIQDADIQNLRVYISASYSN